MTDVKHALSEHPFFHHIEERVVEAVVDMAQEMRFRAGSFIFKEGDESDRLFLIRNGRVSIEIHAGPPGSIMIETLETGDILGWSWSVPPFTKRFDARAVEETRAIAIDGARLRALCEKDHDIGFELMKRVTSVVARRLQATRLQLIDLVTYK